MRLALLSVFLALPIAAQPVIYGKLTVSQQAITKRLAGKQARAIMLGNLNVCATAPVSDSVTDLKIHISSVDFLDEVDAVNLLTQAFNNQTPQRLINDATLASGAIGAAAALRAGLTSLPVIGWLLAGISFLQTEVGPMLAANEIPLASTLSNQLVNMGTNGIVQLGPQSCISNARVFVTRAGKGFPVPFIQNFSYVPGTPPNTPMLHASSNLNTDALNGLVAANIAREMPVEPVQSGISKWDSGSDDTWKIITADPKPVVVVDHPIVALEMPPICRAEGVVCEHAPPQEVAQNIKDLVIHQPDTTPHLTESGAAIKDLQKQVAALTAVVQRLNDSMTHPGTNTLTP
jgi:hypothetical protein